MISLTDSAHCGIIDGVRSLVHISHLLGVHDERFLEPACATFDSVHLITFRHQGLPDWLGRFSNLEVHNLEKEGRPYDDPDESRYKSLRERIWIGLNLRRYASTVRDLAAKINPAMIQGMWTPTDGWVAARSHRRPFLAIPLVTDVVKKPSVSKRLHRRIGWTLAQADRILVDCQWVKNEILHRYPELDHARFVVFPRGVDLRDFHPAPSPQTEVSVPTILCNRSFEAVYDHETLFQALDLVDPQTEFRIELVGNGSLEDVIRTRVDRSKWRAKVKMTGAVPPKTMAEMYRRSQIYVSTATQDGTSVSLLEAMASGVPPVVTRLPSNEEWVEDQANGFVFDAGDAPALAAILQRLLSDTNLRSNVGARALDVARKRANWEEHRATLIRLYEEVS